MWIVKSMPYKEIATNWGGEIAPLRTYSELSQCEIEYSIVFLFWLRTDLDQIGLASSMIDLWWSVIFTILSLSCYHQSTRHMKEINRQCVRKIKEEIFAGRLFNSVARDQLMHWNIRSISTSIFSYNVCIESIGRVESILIPRQRRYRSLDMVNFNWERATFSFPLLRPTSKLGEERRKTGIGQYKRKIGFKKGLRS